MPRRVTRPNPLGERYSNPPLTGRPTAKRPGTSRKIEVMRRRYGRGRHLYHPRDATMDGEDLGRLPVLQPRNHKLIGWTIVSERDYRRQLALQVADVDDDW